MYRNRSISRLNLWGQSTSKSVGLGMVATGQEMVRGKKILHGQGKVRKFYFESRKIDILKKSQGKLKFNTADLIPFRAGQNISGHCDLNDFFSLIKKENLLETYQCS